MLKQDLNSWRQTGLVHLWRFTENEKNYPGWHLATDPAGHASLLDLLRRLRNTTESGASRAVHPTNPSSEILATVNNRRSPIVSPTRVRVVRSDVADQWTIAECDADVTVKIGVDHLDGVVRWLAAPAAAFNTTYGKDPPVWFWDAGIRGFPATEPGMPANMA